MLSRKLNGNPQHNMKDALFLLSYLWNITRKEYGSVPLRLPL
jgi:hypothetical protein